MVGIILHTLVDRNGADDSPAALGPLRLFDRSPVAASGVLFAIQRREVFIEGPVAVGPRRRPPVPIRLGYRAARVAPAQVAVHQRVEELEASGVSSRWSLQVHSDQLLGGSKPRL
jgi:hypothetical protein